MNRYIAALALTALAAPATAGSLDLAVSGVGVSLGNSSRLTGVRVNLIDHDVQRVNGLNLTLWKARRNPDAVIRGAGIGRDQHPRLFSDGRAKPRLHAPPPRHLWLENRHLAQEAL